MQSIAFHARVRRVLADTAGHLATATSTGDISAKAWGRVDDTAIIGAGTYVDDHACAVACTGSGGHFIRLAAARHIAVLVPYGRLTLQAAVDLVVQSRLTALVGEGGFIAVSADGQPAWSYNSSAMFRARGCHGEASTVALIRSEP